MNPRDFPGTQQAPLEKIPTSEDLWDFSFFLSKFGEWNREAFFASQPESCLVSFALREAKENASESMQEGRLSSVGPEQTDNSGSPCSLPEDAVCSQNCNLAAVSSVREKLHYGWNCGHFLGLYWWARMDSQWWPMGWEPVEVQVYSKGNLLKIIIKSIELFLWVGETRRKHLTLTCTINPHN